MIHPHMSAEAGAGYNVVNRVYTRFNGELSKPLILKQILEDVVTAMKYYMEGNMEMGKQRKDIEKRRVNPVGFPKVLRLQIILGNIL